MSIYVAVGSAKGEQASRWSSPVTRFRHWRRSRGKAGAARRFGLGSWEMRLSSERTALRRSHLTGNLARTEAGWNQGCLFKATYPDQRRPVSLSPMQWDGVDPVLGEESAA